MTVKTLQVSSALSDAEYQDLVTRVRDCASRTIPPGGRVLVVSKGDDLLLQLGTCHAAHFPQETDGRYAGYYPSNSTAATEHLEALRGRGAEYLLFPSTAMWWLDHYADFRRHLHSRYRVLASEPACVIFSLRAARFTEGAASQDLLAARHDQELRQLRELLHSLLPDDASIAVVAAGDPALLDLGFANAQEFSPAPAGGNPNVLAVGGGFPRDLHDLASSGVEYVIVPGLASTLLDDYRDIVAKLEADCQPIVSQQHLGSVFLLQPLKEESWPG